MKNWTVETIMIITSIISQRERKNKINKIQLSTGNGGKIETVSVKWLLLFVAKYEVIPDLFLN